MTFYDLYGKAIAYCEDNENIYLFNGQPVAYLHQDSVYSFNGNQFGWFEDEWVRDLNGKCVFFTEYTTGSVPVKPLKHAIPVKHVKHVKPNKNVRDVKKVKAMKSSNWSKLSGIQFFQ